MTARSGPRPKLSTSEILEAVAWLGTRWTLLFTEHEITTINEALDRELLRGTLLDAHTLSPAGWELVRAEADRSPGRLEVRDRRACRDHDECWELGCARCRQLHKPHVVDLAGTARDVVAAHDCPGPRAPMSRV